MDMCLHRIYLMLKLVCSACLGEFGSGNLQPALTSRLTLNSLIWWSIISYLQRLKIFEVVFPFIIIVISAALRQERRKLMKCDKQSDQFEDQSPWKDQSIHNMQKNLLFISIASHTSPCWEMCWSTSRNKPLPFILCFECYTFLYFVVSIIFKLFAAHKPLRQENHKNDFVPH